MVRFKKNTICRASIGEKLREARVCYGLELDEIAETLLIQKKNLEYLEKNEFSNISEELYRELFLKAYSTFLGLDWETLREQYVQEYQLYGSGKNESTLLSRGQMRKTSFWVTPKIIRNSVLSLSVAGGFLYIIFLGFSVLRPPELVVYTPNRDITSSNTERMLVAGKTKEDATITINGQAVVKKQDGTFLQEVTLSEGLNTIAISASKKFSRSNDIIRKVVFKKINDTYSYKN